MTYVDRHPTAFIACHEFGHVDVSSVFLNEDVALFEEGNTARHRHSRLQGTPPQPVYTTLERKVDPLNLEVKNLEAVVKSLV